MANPLSVLVTGATGKQGGAVASLLLKKGHQVRALTRKPNSPAAEELKRQGAEILIGDFKDRASLGRAMTTMDAVFAMSTPFEGGAEVETEQGMGLTDAAKVAGIQHMVFTSVACADRSTGIPYFDSKARVEEHIRELNIPHTIIGPAFFMENFASPWWLPGLLEGKLTMAMSPSRKLQQISTEDIAGFAVLALERRGPFIAKRVDIASDEVTGREAAGILSRVMDREIRYVELPLPQLRAQNEDFAKMFEWFERGGCDIDIEGLRRDYPEVGWHRFEDWAKEQNWRALTKAVGP